jgi:hypothetical protein
MWVYLIMTYEVQKWLRVRTTHMQSRYRLPSLLPQIKIWLLNAEVYYIRMLYNKENGQNLEPWDSRVRLIFKAHVLFMAVFLPAQRLLRVPVANFGAKPGNYKCTPLASPGTSALCKMKVTLQGETFFVPGHRMLPTRSFCKRKFETCTWTFADYISPSGTRLHCRTTNSEHV